MGDALNALRPQRLRTKAASSLLPHWLDGYSECNSCSSRVLLAHVESANCPVAYQGLKITTSLSYVSMIFSACKRVIFIGTLIYCSFFTLAAFAAASNASPKVAKQAQARHATSRNSGTPVAVIRSPTQRIGDAPAALRPPQTEHKAAQSWLPQMALRLFGIKF
ncbi:hypothetical protein BJAS_P1720 [Bathymodiolus japonicus methanotrophic gill symbiont]|uniref:hypothetical protein n=1 Tax=Bathymodiolus japonicus methanotrophic gill symbiont TaxID=113269 RepID=UPI001B3D7074|nr:hypothetical protein [Bathymodiolus japonicus methanotrophic gill symbiont]GFO71905.1 hypothetical protein BJAS_P1720 [Bathymodiolus japonicus methanotrophic gill symbiont]